MAVLTIVLTGARGFLGRYLATELERRALHVVTAGRGGCDLECDLADPASLRRALGADPPDAIVNCAAVSTLAAAAADPDAAVAVNARAVAVLGEGPSQLVQVSTDLVFDGRRAPYRSGDEASPLSVYGASKLAGETAALSAGGSVVRLPLLFGRSPDGRRGATDMLRTAALEQRGLTLYSDEFRTPMHAADAARAVASVLLERAGGRVVHAAGPERVSRWELATRFAALAGLETRGWERGECSDPDRPRDVSLVGDWLPGRGLDEALAES